MRLGHPLWMPWVLAPTLAFATPTPCAAPGETAMSQRRYRSAAVAFEAAAALPQCETERERLRFNAAFALHEHARETHDATWCEARNAYAMLAAAKDTEIFSAAAEGEQVTEQSCAIFDRGRRQGVKEGPSHWWLTGTGLALLGASGLMIGFGVDAYATASTLDDDLRNEPASDPDRALRQRRAEGGATALLAGGGVLATASIVVLLASIGLRADGKVREPSARIEAGLGGAQLRVRF